MRTSVKVLAAVGVLVLCALAAAELLQRARSSSRTNPGADPGAPPASVRAEPAPEEAAPAEPASDYTPIAQRDLFRPLVSVPKAAEGGAG